MRWIETLPFGVHGCTAVPFIAKDPEGFFDLQVDNQFADPVFVSATAVNEMATKLGWTKPAEVAELRDENLRLHMKARGLEDELQEADRFQQNIDGLTKKGYMLKKAPGRPKTTTKAD